MDNDELLFGWDATPGIISVWAERDGQALVWRRSGGQLVCERERFRPWLFAAHLDDLAHLGAALQPSTAPAAEQALVRYQVLSQQSAVSSQQVAGGSQRVDTTQNSSESSTLNSQLFTLNSQLAYLLSSRSGRALERELLAGARRRLGREVASLYDLDDYYRVGPVEQYLMQTGRVYFRGLSYSDLHRLQLDFETTALSPGRGRIFMAAVRDTHGLELTLDAPEPDDEARLIVELCALIRERDPDIIENHNLFGFDLPFLEARATALGVPLALGRVGGPALLQRYDDYQPGPGRRRRARYTIAGRELVDTLDAVRRHDFVARDLPSHRLKDVARHFGVAGPERVYLVGAEVYATYRSEPEKVRRYALDDVAEVDGLSQRLLGAPFALAGMAPRRYERLVSAGPAMGILEPLLVRAYLRAGAALPQPDGRDADLPPHTGGALHLFATGIAEPVVKADIASLYPSLMRIYQIGPDCDQLGALLQVVDRMTELRLMHKDAMRSATPGSHEAGWHNAMQAAMKLLINSAYGYMGAGTMALFADRRAADEVTRRGREVLGQVVAALEGRGMALIEADTDGVYFAVPAGWPAERERALVAEIAAELPVGIRLEYEGRYQAMFSHEVKNYALLTYSGNLIVRGVAMRSSRAEPFGERFLYQALHCLLVGDVAGVLAAFHDMASAIRERRLPAADLASRTRLSKTPEQYAKSRTGHREGPYEALLAAGRTRWQAGERVRCYRRRDGSYAWLPDETEQRLVDDEDDERPGGEGEEETGDTRHETGERKTRRVGEQRKERGGVQAEEPSIAVKPHYSAAQHAAAQLPDTHPPSPNDARDYDTGYYLGVLVTSYAARLRKAFAPADFDQLFRIDAQLGLFDQPIAAIEPRWIRCR